jgi:hypothetical protein
VPCKILTVLLASAVPASVGVVLFVVPLVVVKVGAVGAVVSTTKALLPPRELVVAKAGRANKASTTAKLSLIVPTLRVRAVVERYSKSAEVSPAWTT